MQPYDGPEDPVPGVLPGLSRPGFYLLGLYGVVLVDLVVAVGQVPGHGDESLVGDRGELPEREGLIGPQG